MFPVLALIFIVVPVVEIFLLIQVGGIIGAVVDYRPGDTHRDYRRSSA